MRIALISVLCLFVSGCLGCGGMGGQGFTVRITAERGSTIGKTTIHMTVDDGGTDLPGILYRPDLNVDKLDVSDINVDKSRKKTTTQPVE